MSSLIIQYDTVQLVNKWELFNGRCKFETAVVSQRLECPLEDRRINQFQGSIALERSRSSVPV